MKTLLIFTIMLSGCASKTERKLEQQSRLLRMHSDDIKRIEWQYDFRGE